jgi:hypothetical protein
VMVCRIELLEEHAEEREKYPGRPGEPDGISSARLLQGCETNLNCPGLLSSTPRSRFAPVRLKDLKDLELEVDVARRLRLAVIAHICLVVPVIAVCSLVRFW